MDIRSKGVVEIAVLHLRDAEDEPMYDVKEDGTPDRDKPMTVTLYSPGSKQFAKAQAWQNNKWVERLKRKGKNAEQSADEKIKEEAEFYAMCTKEMSGVEYGDLAGEDLFKAVYADTSVGFIITQVKNHLGDWANFSKRSTGT